MYKIFHWVISVHLGMCHPGHHPPTPLPSATTIPWVWFCHFFLLQNTTSVDSKCWTKEARKMYMLWDPKFGDGQNIRKSGIFLGWGWRYREPLVNVLVGKGQMLGLASPQGSWSECYNNGFVLRACFETRATSTTLPPKSGWLGGSRWTCRGPGASAAPFRVWSASGFHNFSVLFWKNS